MYFILGLAVVVVYFTLQWIFKEKKKESVENVSPITTISELNLQKLREIPWSNELNFQLNGVQVRLINPNPTELLATYIREKAGLKGTKLGCEEGGCGACTVVLTKPEGTISVNSCLRPLCTNDGYSITTVEGIGSVSAGLSTEQQSIVEEHGTQCGFCTPGWITNMHALNTSVAESNSANPTGREIDAYFDGNICRYRPILKAFKRNCQPEDCAQCPRARTNSCPSHNHTDHQISVEDIGITSISSTVPPPSVSSSTIKKRSTPLGRKRLELLSKSFVPLPLHFTGPNTHWYRPVDLSQLSAILREYYRNPRYEIQLVGGNTSIGVTKYFNHTAPYNSSDRYNVFIDINSIPELSFQTYDSLKRTLCVGATTTLTELIDLLKIHSNGNLGADMKDDGVVNHQSIFSVTANHLRKIANTQVNRAPSSPPLILRYCRSVMPELGQEI
jgi:xanthine dehydrogenase/oxidase